MLLPLPCCDADVAIYDYHRRAAEAEKGRELLDREDCIDNEADRVRHSQLMHKLNKADLALLQVQASVLLMEHF